MDMSGSSNESVNGTETMKNRSTNWEGKKKGEKPTCSTLSFQSFENLRQITKAGLSKYYATQNLKELCEDVSSSLKYG